MANPGNVVKLIVVGDSGVGKSAITFRLCDDVFFPDGAPTLGVDFKYTRLPLRLSNEAGTSNREELVGLQIWDTAGQEVFQALTTTYYRGTQGVLLCFDLTSRETFHALPKWMKRLETHLERTTAGGVSMMPPIVLVGCKTDLADDPHDPKREVTTSEACQWAAAHGANTLPIRDVAMNEKHASNAIVAFFETSAKDNHNVLAAFHHLMLLSMEHQKQVATKKLAERQPAYLRSGQTLSKTSSYDSQEPQQKKCSC